MSIVDRVKNICLAPATEWSVIAGENTAAGTLITGYVVPLAAIGAVAGFIGGSIVGFTVPFTGLTVRTPMAMGIVGAVFTVVMAVVAVFVLSLIINALAPTFGAQKDSAQALKVAVYSFTPAWVAGVFGILPALGFLGIIGGLYGLYLLYLGLPRLMKCPEDKAMGYTAIVVVCAVVLMFVIGAIGAAITGAAAIGGSMMGGGAFGGATASDVQVDPNSPLGKLQQLGQSLDESAKKMDAAEKSGDPGAQMAAAMEGLGTLLGGGRRVDPVAVEELRPFVPETFAGLPRKSNNAERTGLAGLMVSRAEATYSDDAQKNVTLEVTDTGGVSGLMGLANWMGVEGEKSDDQGSERTHRVDGRLVHERMSKTGGTNEFAIVIGDRFLVSAKGRGVGTAELKAAVSGLDLARLESMKNAGAQN
jgi:hypothetical protein